MQENSPSIPTVFLIDHHLTQWAYTCHGLATANSFRFSKMMCIRLIMQILPGSIVMCLCHSYILLHATFCIDVRHTN
eukprot:c40855_g1_i1 orf=3-230(-)